MTDNNSNDISNNPTPGDEFPESDTSGTSDETTSFQLSTPGGVQPRSATTRSGQLSSSTDESESDELVNSELVEAETDPTVSMPAIPETHPYLIEATSTPLTNDHPILTDDDDPLETRPITEAEEQLFDTDEPGYSMVDLSPAEQAYMAGDTSLAEGTHEVTDRALSQEKSRDTEQSSDPNAPLNDRELDLFEHLRELRTRLLYSVYAILLAMCGTWNYGTQISDWFAAPIRQALSQYGPKGSTIQAIEPTESFMVYLQITAVAAILLVMPFLLFQLWRFIEPAMTRREKRFTKFLVPFSVGLFFAGSGLGYYVSPLFFRFFLQFQPPNMPANYAYQTSVVLLAKMLLVFGICFQVPVITIFLTKAGIVTRNVLIDYWRHAVVVIFTVVAVLTPTWDPVTLMICAIPPSLLYIFSIWLVKWL